MSSPRIIVHTWEVMVERPHSGKLVRLSCGGLDAAREYSSLVAAEQFIERYWDAYKPYNADGNPVIVRRT